MTNPVSARPAGIDTEACYRQYGAMVLRRCRRMLRDEERARDAMHDVFVKVLRYRDRLDESAPSRLLSRIATNVCLNHLRSARRRPEVVGESPVEQIAPGADPESIAASRILLDRLFHLEADSTALIAVLRYQDGMTAGEVGRAVGMSATGVRKRLLRLRDRLPGLTGGAGPRALPARALPG